jgi:NAD(P)-dependent dehydrogenase (short-subunit alcohol dehydrogenase family)
MGVRAVSELAGRGAVVTGGGRGIGAAVASRLAAAGVRVVCAARSGDQVDAVAASLRAGGVEAWGVACDVTDEGAVARLMAEAKDRLGGVDILVNNAGSASSSPLHRTTLEEWNRLLAVNATSAFLCTRAVVPEMVERGWGRVVNVASVAGLHGARYIAAYTAAKHAMVGLTRAAAAEVAGRGVTVNAVCPGYVDTPMTEETIARIVERTGRSAEAARAALVESSPLGRLIAPEEVAEAVAYLCGAGAAGVNGHALVLDGGALQA